MKNFPELIIHNSVSLDGSITGFMPDMETHYRIAGYFRPQVHLIGSETILKGIEMFGVAVPPEEPGDFIKPERDPGLPLWVVVDSGARLAGMHHTSRRFELCRDVVVLVSSHTPRSYLNHLEERNYGYIVTGKEKVDLKEAIAQLSERYKADTIMTDTGAVLGNLLINLKLASRISLLIHPLLTGKSAYGMFGNVEGNIDLIPEKREEKGNGLLWLLYRIRYN